ncbi:unnamed protein product [Rotaria socialis]|uniref:TRPM SLOG domain-containing protein n=1 Tax=Rotaria socialis TaxID=392032 RepID=A0A821QV03_9BILA|nr:unnamed protein product [Rotaria socialis]
MVDTVTQAAPLKSYVRIAEAVHNWAIENNSKYWDRHIQDYGQIHFTENDRKSWYIRYPFNPPYAVQSASQNDNHQQRKMTALKEKERDDESSFSTINVLQSISHTIVPMQTVSCEPAKHLIELLRDKWELPPPELIISVTGGARSFNLPQQSRTALQKGLVAAAVTADAWVFTGGTHAGVMKDVGEAFEKWTYKTTSVDKTHTRVPVIAIASWYYTANYSQLIQERSQKWNTNSTPISTFDTVADHEKLYRYCAPQKTSKSYPLDPNHTHFILLDDKCGASNDKWEQYGFPVRADLTIQLRAEIEQEARYSSRYRQNYKIPIIQILIEGGPSSLLTMVEAVTHETPVIVIEGTGRAANFIAKAYNALYHNQKTYVPSTNNNPNLERLIKEANGEIITKSNESCFRDMITSEKGFFLINTFLLCPDDSEFKLGDAILEALFRAASMPRHEASDAHVQKLKLAMAWNKFDLAVSDMFIEDNKILWTDTQMDSALLHAIQHGSVQFVELLIEQGASFDRLRRLININDLYKKKTGLPLSNQKIALDDINKQQMYYTHYLNAEALKTVDSFQGTKAPHLSNIDIYGTIENPMEQATNLNGLVVFNGDDAIRQSGNVTQVSIAFSDSRYPSVTIDMLHDLVLYVLSPTSVANSFQLIHMQKIYERDCKYHQSKSIFHVYDFNIYIEQGQYLAVGFLENSRSPSYLDDQGLSYALDIDVVNKLSSTNASIEFKRYIRRVAISFQLVPVSEFIRDIFLWSVFADSFNLSICLCSHSPNAMIAALLASKINKTAAELANDKELAIKYLKKKTEFDVHAAQIIDKCFLQDENFALQLLTTRSHLYFGYSSLKLAEETNNRSFLATRCVQAYADRLWKRGNWLKRIIYDRLMDFFRGRAIIRFYYSIIFYVIFLGLFSFVMLLSYFPYNNNRGKRSGYSIGIPISEIMVHLCIWGLITEEVVQFGVHCREGVKRNSRIFTIITSYFLDDNWNILDAAAICIYLVGFITRFIVIEQVFVISKIFMCIDLFLWYVRILHLFFAYERLGPKLLMIFNTMKDLVFFTYFIFIFFAAYSISSFSLITTSQQIAWIPNENVASSRTYIIVQNETHPWTWNLLRNVLDWGIWKIYGQIDLIDYRLVDAPNISDDVYSFLDGGSELHANVMDLIVFNIDNYVVSAGMIDKFLINFCRAPTESNAKIKVYIIRSIFNNREHFFCARTSGFLRHHLRPSVGIQKYQVKPFKVQKGDYVGFKFTKNAGDPFTIKHASYYVEHNVDQSIETKEIMHFNPCANHGITATYTMSHDENKDDSIRKNNFILFKRKTAYSSHVGLTPSSDDKKQLIIDKSGRSSIAVPVRQDLTNLTQFQQRDNMLRESSIAQDYLQLVIENIMREERDDSSRERKSRFKNEQESLKLQNQQEKLIELLQKTNNKNQNRSPKNSCSSSYDNDTAV